MDKFLIRGGSAASQAVKRPGSSLVDNESQKKKPKFDNRKYDQTQRVRNFQEKNGNFNSLGLHMTQMLVTRKILKE